jgi:hypothetical protein
MELHGAAEQEPSVGELVGLRICPGVHT